MRQSKLLTLLAIILLCVVLPAVSLAEGRWSSLWDSGCALLFRTDNVTVDGKASFALDGDRFKTANIHYVQDGCCSLYDLKLLTPKADGTERESGWTIIADDDENIYVMEVYYPGKYREGSDGREATLLRRTVQLDAITDLGGLILKQLEPTLPADALTVSETEGGQTIHIALTADQIPDMAASALNLAAGYLSNRWFSYGRDRSVNEESYVSFENFATVTEALTYGTVRWALRSLEADLTLDSQGRLTAVCGTLCAESTFVDKTVRLVEVDYDFTMTEYGTSYVRPFDPEEYGVGLFEY
jgi:hypothetical protein